MSKSDRIQRALRELNLKGWLFYGFQNQDPIAARILGLDPGKLSTRRWYYLVPAEGEPRKLVHGVEPDRLDHLPGEKTVYSRWSELATGLGTILNGLSSVAMQYSPENAVPYISRVDAGTVELVRSLGVEVVSSADLVQIFEATWNEEQLAGHRKSAAILKKLVDEAFGEIARCLRSGRTVTEYEIQQFLVRGYAENNLHAETPPIVGVNENASNPHYEPTKEKSSAIRKDDLVLLDVWAKERSPESVYADITWMGYAGEAVPEKYENVFRVIREARDLGFEAIKDAFREGKPIRGCDADDVVRGHVARNGYEKYFIHRTGHSIGIEDHANGANLDNFETRDERRIIPGTAFSIEPGIYLPDFGLRTEINVHVSDEGPAITTLPLQNEIVPILR
ncbi:MAG: M24 family metallopeptidase [bacterium]